MGQAAIPLMLAGGAISAIGSYQQGKAAQMAAEYNARLAEQNAQLTRAQAIEEERRVRVMARKDLGSIRAGYAASGVTMEGSAADFLEESAANAELDALTVRHGGMARVAGYTSSAAAERMGGSNAFRSGQAGAVSNLLLSGGQAASYYRPRTNTKDI